MEELNKKRVLIRVIEELSMELGFQAEFISEDWIICLHNNNKTYYIYGYNWQLDSATTQLILKDKAATSDILSRNGIKTIEHKLFFNYNLQARYLQKNGCWDDIMEYAQSYHDGNEYRLLCKPNQGTGGNDIYIISTQLDLENSVHKLFSKYRDLCLCPFYDIQEEYRAITLNGEILLLYSKERPYVMGNGKDELSILITKKYKNKGILYFENVIDKLDYIPKNKEITTISWKHNLGTGAKAQIIEDDNIKIRIGEIVRKIKNIFDINFVSVDIALIHGEYYVMEINSGIMIEAFAKQKPDENYNYYSITKSIYKKALIFLFNN